MKKYYPIVWWYNILCYFKKKPFRFLHKKHDGYPTTYKIIYLNERVEGGYIHSPNNLQDKAIVAYNTVILDNSIIAGEAYIINAIVENSFIGGLVRIEGTQTTVTNSQISGSVQIVNSRIINSHISKHTAYIRDSVIMDSNIESGYFINHARVYSSNLTKYHCYTDSFPIYRKTENNLTKILFDYDAYTHDSVNTNFSAGTILRTPDLRLIHCLEGSLNVKDLEEETIVLIKSTTRLYIFGLLKSLAHYSIYKRLDTKLDKLSNIF